MSVSFLPAQAAERGVSFNRDIRPILSDKCFFCHGPDTERREADLRLDDRDAAIAADTIHPDQPDTSEMLRTMLSDDPDERMPPPESKKEITPAERELIRKWIEQGAPYAQHWAFQPIISSEPPVHPDDTWSRSPIDRFLYQTMREHDLIPNLPAAPETLLRRVTFDLTGLPPNLEELDAFLKDPSEAAYEAAVDRLLASEAYGERMTSDWLDVARYSDTYGYQVDRDRYVWPWRDWVIRAFNRNKPYDQFVTEQLAGDLLPEATDEQILATTFNRLHPQKVEGGSTPEEFRVEYVADRTQTVATAFLGLTMECARCHSHKYDPITQTEYYQLASFFDNIEEAGLYSFFTSSVPTPTLLMATDAQKQALAAWQQKISEAESLLNQTREQEQAAYIAWRDAESLQAPEEDGQGSEKLPGTDDKSAPASAHPRIPGRIAYLDFEEEIRGNNQGVPGKHGQAVQLTGDDVVPLTVGNFQRWEPFTVSLWMQTPDVKDRAVIFHRSRAWTDAGSRGYELLIEDGKLTGSLIHFLPGNAISVQTAAPIPVGEWLHVAFTYDGSSKASGIGLWINGQRAEKKIVLDELTKSFVGGGQDHINIGERFRDRGFTNGKVDDFQVFARELAALEIRHLFDGQTLDQLYENFASARQSISEQDLRGYFEVRFSPPITSARNALKDARQQYCSAVEPIPEIMVMREKPEPRKTFRLVRGVYSAPAEEVKTDVPSIFPLLPENEAPDRLALAHWLTSPAHPLTARVAVNRYWQLIFEQGLVRTPEDFGSQGMPPSHPELLDWLASDFQQHGWDIKRLLKQIVMSSVYRQSSRVEPQELKQDPTNTWLARYPAHRLSAEMLRDNALATSGLLVQKQGGPPVHPYELEDSFKPSKRSSGEGLYRRSLYTYWKRTSPAPAMTTFDAAKRDVCQVKREKTSSPLQAFVMLNGPQFVEASRQLAHRQLQQTPDKPEQAVLQMFRLLTSRSPSAQEQQILLKLYEANRDRFAAQP
ncbi:MAG: DUF1553 domain-containing protein, partial [Planctomycetaceae bacterium]|nr:DUF1553 domain-containing protein [Planctomycetaceae bacterium]